MGLAYEVNGSKIASFQLIVTVLIHRDLCPGEGLSTYVTKELQSTPKPQEQRKEDVPCSVGIYMESVGAFSQS